MHFETRIFTMLAMLLWAGTTAAGQQLNANCTVSILNRTAQVRGNGTWVLGNVPSNMGLVRARATCVENGVTRVGQSGYFRVPTDGTVTVGDISFVSIEPVPAKLTLTAPRATLRYADDTLQLTATATLPTGTSADVTARGTNFTTSNPAVATVSATGLVSARASGVVIVTALNEGALALFRVSVDAVADSDGDGMPDDFELTNGFNPNSRADGPSDADGDGLSNVDEFRGGTNPRIADTDGDGLRDGVEVQTGTDPLDPSSFDFSRALTSIRLSPAALFIVANTIEGEASRTVRVLGEAIDGTTVDLTARSRGTVYQSSNVAVASVGVTDGQVFAGTSGEATLTVRNSGFVATAPVSVSTFAPTPLSTLRIPGYANNVEVRGNFAYVAAGSAGLQIVDVTNRRAPRITGSFDTAGNANDVRVVGTVAYVADGNNGIVVIDVSVPSQPALVATLDTPGAARSVAPAGGLLYVADGTSGLHVVDVTTPAAPSIVASVSFAGADVRGIDADNGLAVAATSTGVHVLNVVNPRQPAVAGSVATTNARDVELHGATALVADAEGSLRLIDVSVPSVPQLVASTTTALGGMLNDVAASGQFAFGADFFFVNGVPIVDVSSPANPMVRGRIDFPSRDDNGIGISVDSTYVYLVAGASGQKPGTTGDTVLYIAQYRAVEDRLGMPPTVRITSPVAGSSVVEGTSVTVDVAASDDVHVHVVSLVADGVAVGTTSTVPYRFSVPVPIGATTLDLQASAFDIGGNLGVAERVTVAVTRDLTPPTAAITSPLHGQSFGSGAPVTVHVTAADAGGIGRVELFVNGALTQTDTTAPYTFTHVLPDVSTTVTFGARAVDRAGNGALTPNVTVTVLRDDPPKATMSITPAPPDSLFSGGDIFVSGNATDDKGVVSVELLLNDVVVQTYRWRFPAYSFDAQTVPVGVVSVTVRVTDTGGRQTTLPPVFYNVKPTSALGKVTVPGRTTDVGVHGSHAYVVSGTDGLHVISIENPAAPLIVGSLDTPGSARELAVVAPYAFIADGQEGVHVVDIRSASTPAFVATYRTFGSAYALAYAAGRLYVGTQFGFEVLDVRDPRLPRRLGSAATSRPVLGIAEENGIVTVLIDTPVIEELIDVASYDVSNPQQPVARGAAMRLETDFWSSLQVQGGRAYIASEAEFYIVDVTGPTPQLVGVTPSVTEYHYGYSDVRVIGDLAITSSSEHVHSATLVGISDPTRPAHVGTVDFRGIGPYFGTAIEADRELLYTTGLSVHPEQAHYMYDGVTSAFFTGRYRAVIDTAAVAPQVHLASPAGGAVRNGEAVLIRAEATDDVAVKSVALLVNDVVVSESTIRPYEFLYIAPAGTTSFAVKARATDFAGLTTTTAAVSVALVADNVPPTVQITNPRDGKSALTAGTRITAAATDDVSVERVEFLVNGAVIASDWTYPYETEYRPPAGMVAATVAARAYDASGNVGDAAGVPASFFAPVQTGSVALPIRFLLGLPLLEVDVSGSHAFVAGSPVSEARLNVVDVSNPAAPRLVGSADAPYATTVRVLGNYAYVGTSGVLTVFDVSNPSQPLQVARSTSGGSVAVTGVKAYTSNYAGTNVFDVSVPSVLSVPTLLNRHDGAVAAENDRVVVASSALTAYRTETPWGVTNIRPVYETRFMRVGMFDGFISATDRNFITVTDFHEKLSWSKVLTWVPDPNEWAQVTDAEAYDDILAVSHESSSGVALYDISNRREPVLLTVMNLAAARRIYSISLTPTHIIAATMARAGGFALVVGQYRTFTDTKGVAPSVAVAPFPGTARTGSLFNLRAHASDDVGVMSVTFSVNGIDVHTDNTLPYEFNYLVPAGVTALDIQARARDYAGATTVSATRSAAVTP